MYDPYAYGKYIMRKTYETYLSITKKNERMNKEEEEKDAHTHIIFIFMKL